MKILDNIIINFDFPGNFEEVVEREVQFLQSFLSEQRQLVFLELESNIYPNADSEITGISSEIKKIVLENTILKTKEELSDVHDERDENECYYWFSPRNKDEIIKIVKYKYHSYYCIVLENGRNIKEYDYLLTVIEHLRYDENDDCRAMIIKERIENSFAINIKPKIEKNFKSLIE